MRTIVLIAILLIHARALSQRVVDVDKENLGAGVNRAFLVVGGEPINTLKYVKVVEGSPYFSEKWMKGTVILSQGRQYNDLLVRLDLITNELIYKDEKDKELIATTPLSQVWIIDSLKHDTSRFVYSTELTAFDIAEKGWYQLLQSGKTQLYRHITKTIIENKPYSSATTEQKIEDKSSYIVVYKGSIIRIKKFKDIPQLLHEKHALLTDFIRTNNLTGKTAADYIKVVNYFNTL